MQYRPKAKGKVRSKQYRVRFKWQGRTIDRPTRTTDKRVARQIEAKIRAELALGNYKILVPEDKPTLSEFLKRDFKPFVESHFAEEPKTKKYYLYGIEKLTSSRAGGVKVDEVTGQHAAELVRTLDLGPSTVNCVLRTLRRALNLGVEWRVLDRAPRIQLAKGERQRERVLSDAEFEKYVEKAEQPWRDVATIMFYEGMRPSEVFSLRWEQIFLGETGSYLQVFEGKTKAARRVLPLVPEVAGLFTRRAGEQGQPKEGWVFPSASSVGHIEQGTAKGQHKRALTASGVKPFEPYCLRHTALTRLAPHCDAFALARIAGHSSISITQRYCHPQAETIENAFKRLTAGEAKEKEVVKQGSDSTE